MTTDEPRPRTSRILFVCTGNMCRSAVAERLAAAWLGSRQAPGWSLPQTGSAGTLAVDGRAMHPDSARALESLGGDPGGFTSRRLLDDHLADVDLVLTATRDHRRHVLERRPGLMRRTFTILEAAALVGFADARTAGAPELADHLRERAALLDQARSLRPGGPGDDVLDPIEHPAHVHAEVARSIAHALPTVLDFLFPAAETRRMVS